MQPRREHICCSIVYLSRLCAPSLSIIHLLRFVPFLLIESNKDVKFRNKQRDFAPSTPYLFQRSNKQGKRRNNRQKNAETTTISRSGLQKEAKKKEATTLRTPRRPWKAQKKEALNQGLSGLLCMVRSGGFEPPRLLGTAA